MNAYFMSQFGYCPLVWMSNSRKLNSRINGLHKRLLEKDKTLTIHHRNLQTLAYEIIKPWRLKY